jgi:hypothetical protein
MENNILKYNEFIQYHSKQNLEIVEEGKIANITTAALMTLSSLFGSAQPNNKVTDALPSNVKEILHKTTDDKDELRRLELTGWKLTSTTVEKIYNGLPSSDVKVSEISFGEENFFESGAYKLNVTQMDSLKNMVQDIINDNGGIISSVKIWSSTDKQPLSKRLSDNLEKEGFSGDNKGLSTARSENVKEYLIGLGIDETIFAENTIDYEVGDNEVDDNNRFTKVSIVYFCCDTDLDEPVFPEKTYYHLEKPVYKGGSTKTSTPPKPPKTKKCGGPSKIANFEKCHFQ